MDRGSEERQAWRGKLSGQSSTANKDGWKTMQSGNHLVEPMGFEPTTSSMPSRRAPNCATAPPKETTIVILHEQPLSVHDLTT
jgi:hypothetical protein